MMGGADVSAAVLAGAREMIEAKANIRRKAKAKPKGESRKPEAWPMKYLIETFGCQMNHHDSERMAGLLEQAGYDRTDDDRDADVIVINTCSVREKAEEKLYTRLGEIRMMGDETGSRPVVAVAGCVAQQEGEKLLGKTNGHVIDVLIGTQSLKTAADARRARRRTPAAHRASRLAARVDLNPLRRRLVPAGDRAARRSAQGLRHDHRRLQRVLRLLRRPVHPRQGADAAGRRHRRRGPAGGRHRRARGPAARADRQPLPGAGRPGLRLRGAAVARQRGPGHRADPLRQPAPAPRHAADDAGDARPAEGLPAPAPAGAERVDARAPGDAPAAHARGIPRAGRAAARGHAGHRAIDRYDRRLPGRDRRGLRRHAVADRGGPLPQHVSRSSTRRGRTRWRSSGCPTTCAEDEKTRRIVALQALQRTIQGELFEAAVGPGRAGAGRRDAAGGATGSCRAGRPATRS